MKIHGSISWMANNSVVANLLMIFLLIGGYIAITNTKQEIIPQIEYDIIEIQVKYPGAGPDEIDTAIVSPIDAAISSINDIKKVTSYSQEGICIIYAELFDFIDKQEALTEVRNVVSRIGNLPIGSYDPEIVLKTSNMPALSLIIYGQASQAELLSYARDIKKDLNDINLSSVTIKYNEPITTKIEIKQEKLFELQLSLPEIAYIIDNYSKEVPSGSIANDHGEILIRTTDRKISIDDFASIPIITNNNKTILTLGDIATIEQDFLNDSKGSYFNNMPAIMLQAEASGRESPVDIAKAVKQFIKNYKNTANPNIYIAIFEDRSEIYKGRMNLLLKNAFIGLVLVLLVLSLFLDSQLAIWVMLGLPIAIIGSFTLFQLTGATLNMISLFAFIITLGIVVDDAIIVGEAIYNKRISGVSPLQAAIYGAQEMALPVTFAILTNIVAFAPLLFVPGTSGDLFIQIPAVVIPVLIISLVECLYILPAHLAHTSNAKIWEVINYPQKKFGKMLQYFIDNHYKKFISWGLNNRYFTLTISLSILILNIGIFKGGFVEFNYIPQIDRDTIESKAILVSAASKKQAVELSKSLYKSAIDVENEFDHRIIKGIFSVINDNNEGANVVKVIVSLVPSTERKISGIEFAAKWRDKTPNIPELESINFKGRSGFAGTAKPIQIDVSHPDSNIQIAIANEIEAELNKFIGVTDIDSGIIIGKEQFNISLKENGQSLGFNTNDVANQLRSYLYGIEVQRQQIDADEMVVKLQLDKSDRDSLYDFSSIKLKSPMGGFVPLDYIANIEASNSFSKISRVDGERIISISADIDPQLANMTDIINSLENKKLPDIKEKYPELRYKFAGEQQSQTESLAYLNKAFLISILMIYILLAIPFNSYFQPITIMCAIPFAVIGAIWGHLLLGYSVSIISIIGIIGLTGIVINDSLILIVSIKRNVTTCKDYIQAAIDASTRRFRPIILTSITTFIGLLPMLFETSMQAKFLIPMAISISFGILFSTIIILILVPIIFLIINDIAGLKKHLFSI